MTKASSPSPSTMKARATAGACTSSAARGRPPTTPAQRSSGTAAPVSRSNRDTAASAAPSPDFGTKAVSTPRCPPPRGARRARFATPGPGTRRRRRGCGCRAGSGIRRREPPAPTSQRTGTPTNEPKGELNHGSFGLRARAGTQGGARGILLRGGLAYRRLCAAAHPPRFQSAARLGAQILGRRLAWPSARARGRTRNSSAAPARARRSVTAITSVCLPWCCCSRRTSLFLGSLFGVTWPGLPSSLITVISVLDADAVSGGAVSARDQSGDAHAVEFRRLLQLVHHHAGDRHGTCRHRSHRRARTRRCSRVHILSVDVLLDVVPVRQADARLLYLSVARHQRRPTRAQRSHLMSDAAGALAANLAPEEARTPRGSRGGRHERLCAGNRCAQRFPARVLHPLRHLRRRLSFLHRDRGSAVHADLEGRAFQTGLQARGEPLRPALPAAGSEA